MENHFKPLETIRLRKKGNLMQIKVSVPLILGTSIIWPHVWTKINKFQLNNWSYSTKSMNNMDLNGR